ncbi:MAG: radical SAM protein [Desulfovibrio sp.]|jgi:anaerobic ribonucleoside-triphosphate reductase activating protein|nr:radical SAM protein [Desulfovibrio sp.]
MGHSIRLSGIVEESIVDGPGLRFVVFMQGCPHRCRGCHNPGTHDPAGGYSADTDAIIAQFGANPLLSGMTLSGGEPFLQARAACVAAEHVKRAGKSLVTYTGYLCEDLARSAERDNDIRRLLYLTDILVDGPYIQELRSPDSAFKGSDNQRVLTRKAIHDIVKATLSAGFR